MPPKTPSELKMEAMERMRSSSNALTQTSKTTQNLKPPKDCKDRTSILGDDSGSMGTANFENAKKGIVEYLRNCTPGETAVSVHWLNLEDKKEETSIFSSDLVATANSVTETSYNAGGTPLFRRLEELLEEERILNRIVLFTDGSPTDSYGVPFIEKAARLLRDRSVKARNISIDTVFFGTTDLYTSRERELLQFLSSETGGIFLVFDPSKTNFAKAFKYLAPPSRLMLASESFRKEVEEGKR